MQRLTVKTGALYVLLYFTIVASFLLILTPRHSEQQLADDNLIINWRDVKPGFTNLYEYTTILPNDISPNAWQLKLLEKEYNIKINVMGNCSPNDAITKLPLMLAAGDVPDVFNASGRYLRSFAYHRLILPIPIEMLKEYCPALVKLITEYAPEGWLECSYDGLIYGIPLGLWYEGIIPRTGVWRMDLLETNGIYNIPVTIAEMENAFDAICFDENGKHTSVYGMTGDMINNYSTFTEIFGAFGVMPFNWMVDNAGNVIWGGIDPRAKDALKLLHLWYEKGYIHPDFQIDKWYAQAVNKFCNGKTAYINYASNFQNFDDSSAASITGMLKAVVPEAVAVPAPPPLGPDGELGTHVWGAGALNVVVFGRHMAKSPEKIIRVLQILEKNLTDMDLYAKTKFGERGVHWDWNRKDGGIEFLEPYSRADVRKHEGLIDSVSYIRNYNFLSPAGSGQHTDIYMPNKTLEWIRKYSKTEWGRKDIFRTPDNIQMAEQHMPNLIAMQQIAYVQIITGEKPIHYFDEFVKQWKKSGGNQLMNNAQKTLAFKKKLIREFSSNLK